MYTSIFFLGTRTPAHSLLSRSIPLVFRLLVIQSKSHAEICRRTHIRTMIWLNLANRINMYACIHVARRRRRRKNNNYSTEGTRPTARQRRNIARRKIEHVCAFNQYLSDGLCIALLPYSLFSLFIFCFAMPMIWLCFIEMTTHDGSRWKCMSTTRRRIFHMHESKRTKIKTITIKQNKKQHRHKTSARKNLSEYSYLNTNFSHRWDEVFLNKNEEEKQKQTHIEKVLVCLQFENVFT